jgi:hypothetical protein
MFAKAITYLVVFALAASACARARTGHPIGGNPVRVLNDVERRSVVAAAAQLFALAPAAVPVCVELADSLARRSADDTLLAALGPRARRRSDCPPTYASMISTPNAPPRPPGYADPYHLVVRWPPQTDRGTIIAAELWQGTGFTSYRCEVVPSGAAWKASCRETARGFS